MIADLDNKCISAKCKVINTKNDRGATKVTTTTTNEHKTKTKQTYRFTVAGHIDAIDKMDAQIQIAELLKSLKLFIIRIDTITSTPATTTQ